MAQGGLHHLPEPGAVSLEERDIVLLALPLPLEDTVADRVRVPPLHLVDVVAMAADGHQPRVLQRPGLLRREVGGHGLAGVLVGVLAHRAADDINGGLHAVLFQNRQTNLQIAGVAVVKSDHHRPVRQLLSLLHVGPQVGHGDGGVPRPFQRRHMLVEGLPGHRVLRQVVVHQDGHLGGIGPVPRLGGGLRQPEGAAVRRAVNAEVLGIVGAAVEHPGQHHISHGGAEAGRVIKIPGVPAH